ncbi:hypothetical protein DBR44_10320 [Aquitalea sp. FJL05]|nr:hypothetical protein DBR44_10320 [Aquitalea sp. FJL05]
MGLPILGRHGAVDKHSCSVVAVLVLGRVGLGPVNAIFFTAADVEGMQCAKNRAPLNIRPAGQAGLACHCCVVGFALGATKRCTLRLALTTFQGLRRRKHSVNRP